MKLVWGTYEVKAGDGEVLRFSASSGQLQEIVVRPATYNKTISITRDDQGRIVGLGQFNSGRQVSVEWYPPGGEGGCRSRELIKSITGEAPAPGEAPIRVEYRYTACDRLAEVCKVGVGCEKYAYDDQARLIGGATRAGRPLDRVTYRAVGSPEVSRVDTAADSDQSTTFTYYSLPVSEPAQSDYLEHVNRRGGRTVQTFDGKDETYLFDRLNRLYELDHAPIRANPQTVVYRLWNYSPYTGRLETFFDENFHTTHIIPNPNGDVATRWTNRKVDDVVGANYRYNYTAPLDDPRYGTMLTSYPYDQSTKPYEPETYEYAAHNGLVVSKTMAHETGAPAGTERYSYTQGTEAPEDLLFSVTNASGTVIYDRNRAGDVIEIRNTVTGARTGFERDNLGRMTAKVEYSAAFPQGVRTTYRYDAADNIVGEVYPETTDAVTGEKHQRVVTREFDPDGLLRSENNVDAPASARWRAAHPDRAAADPYTRTTTFRYHPDGKLAERVGPNNASFSYEYHRGRLENVWRPDGNLDVHLYDAKGRLTTVERRSTDGVIRAMAKYGYDPAGYKISEMDAAGRVTRYTYSWDGMPIRAIRVVPATAKAAEREIELWKRSYDALGNVTSETSAAGTRTTTGKYSPAGKMLEQVLDPSGVNRKTTHTNDLWGRPIQIAVSDKDRAQTTKLTYDAGGRVAETRVVTSAGDLVTKKTYDEYGRVLTITDPRGVAGAQLEAYTSAVRYDEMGRVVEERGPPREIENHGQTAAVLAPITTRGYNAFGEQEHLRDARGGVTTAEFDKLGQTVALHSPVYQPAGGPPTDGVVRYEYNQLNQITKKIDAVGGEITYAYDPYGNLTTQSGPKVGDAVPVTVFTYAPGGLVSRMTGPTGAVVEFEYDVFGHVTTKTNVVRVPDGPPLRYSTTSVFDDAGRMTSQTDPANRTTRYTHNAVGEVTGVDPGSHGDQTFEYDFAGNLVRQTDALGRALTTTYDQVGRPTTTTIIGAKGERLPGAITEYDLVGNPIAVTSAEGRRTERTYDAANAVRSIVEHPAAAGAAVTTTFGYDLAGNRTRVTDARGNSTWQTYTPWQLPEREIDPATPAYPAESDRTRAITYDSSGLPITEQRPGGIVIQRTFDPAGNLTGETGTGPNTPTATTSVTYDLAGRVLSAGHPKGRQTFRYDDRGLLLDSDGPAGKAAFRYTAAGQTSERTDATGKTAFTYYDTGTVRTQSNPDTGGTLTYLYAADGQLDTQQLGAVAGRKIEYDAFGRLSKDNLAKPSGTVDTLTYTLDRDNKITGKSSTADAAYGGTYDYDRAGRLTGWNPRNGAPAETYELDQVGNRLSTTVTPAGGTPSVAERSTFDARNQQTTREIPAKATTGYTYSARGTLARETTTLVSGTSSATDTIFDALDRVTSDRGTQYEYDALNRVASRNGVAFAYADGNDDPVVVPATDPAQTETVGRDLKGKATSVKTAQVLTIPWADAHGDIRALVDPATGDIRARKTFTPYGRSGEVSGPPSTLGFQGDWTDPGTGRVSMGARWLDPDTGRFTSRDTVPLSQDTAAGTNRFSYGAGDPISTIDPTGHTAWPWDLGLGGVLDDIGRAIGSWGDDAAALGNWIWGGVKAAGEWASRLPPWVKIPAKFGSRAIPYVGWALLGLDIIDMLDTAEFTGARPVEIPAIAKPYVVPIVAPAPPPVPPPPPPTIVKTVTKRVPVTWMEPEKTTYVPGYRITSYTQHIDTYQHTTIYWSNGAVVQLPPFLSEWMTVSWWEAMPTIDPGRAEQVQVGTTADDILGHTESRQPQEHLGGCGLQGTEVDCLGEALAPTMGGCFTLLDTISACYPDTPNPQANQGGKEQRSTHQGPTPVPQLNTALANSCANGGQARSDGTRSAQTWTNCNLDIDELNGGHAIERHVGKSDQYLIDRNIPNASTFPDLDTAKRAATHNLNENWGAIQWWLNNTTSMRIEIGPSGWNVGPGVLKKSRNLCSGKRSGYCTEARSEHAWRFFDYHKLCKPVRYLCSSI
ncbi:hypothetical protein DL991_27240 [Amycolatopsis sp. WAC 01375]|uniref:RHS repeat-associated core domain-containing protein n=1 Tax=Amycolatopsis sp. WAC 01375 TaxID=2203194 RepID=UPI000F7937A0|nr:RHS repeat-associated core domain-containing protein [Amycolatopsis sp. WAC 01375]RSM75766.1 hypothetical protein DL991_27240 [Amycolatopsis sp. WAC 01375]